MRERIFQRKRILFVMPEANLTGSSICAYKLISYLQKFDAEYDIQVVSSKDGILIDRMRQAGISASVISKQSEHEARIAKLMIRAGFYIRFGLVLSSFRPNILFSNTIYNFGQLVFGKLSGAKTIVHIHEGHNAITRVKKRLRLTSYFTDKYIAVSHYVRNELLKVVSRPVSVIHNGIEPINLDSCDRKANHIPVAGIIGTVDRNKGQLLVVKAVEHLVRSNKTNIILKIVGAVSDRDYFDEIQRYVKAHGLTEHVIFTGVISQLEDIYKSLDLIVVASIDEAFPLVNLEAMAAGKLLIASDTGGNSELVEDGITGYLFAVGDHADLANKIRVAMLHDDVRHQIALNAIEKVRSEFMIEKMYSAIADEIALL